MCLDVVVQDIENVINDLRFNSGNFYTKKKKPNRYVPHNSENDISNKFSEFFQSNNVTALVVNIIP